MGHLGSTSIVDAFPGCWIRKTEKTTKNQINDEGNMEQVCGDKKTEWVSVPCPVKGGGNPWPQCPSFPANCGPPTFSDCVVVKLYRALKPDCLWNIPQSEIKNWDNPNDISSAYLDCWLRHTAVKANVADGSDKFGPMTPGDLNTILRGIMKKRGLGKCGKSVDEKCITKGSKTCFVKSVGGAGGGAAGLGAINGNQGVTIA